MTAQPSRNIVQRVFNPVLPPVIDLSSQAKLVVKDNATDAGPEAFEFVTEKFVDFDSLKENGIDIQSLFYDQQWRWTLKMKLNFEYKWTLISVNELWMLKLYILNRLKLQPT
ncbi:hypothetical protein QL285_087637 [Trifolium repens]|nr:hypothetical protein QL285_087637 [Trifolium repens]